MKEENSKLNQKINPTCHKCNCISHCTIGIANKKIGNCPMIIDVKVEGDAKEIYNTDENIKKTTAIASIIEAKGYIHWPRLKDTIEYAKGMGYKKLGLAFCVGMIKETRRIAEILEKYGFEVCSVCCKTGSIKKTRVGIPDEFSMISKTGYLIGFVTCNPVAQALLLNKTETELNIIIGLCVGHDITFTNLSKAPVTTLIAKDRANPHNPAAILFSHYGDAFFLKDLQEIKKRNNNKKSEIY